jgi:Cu2+-exporting ATPase
MIPAPSTRPVLAEPPAAAEELACTHCGLPVPVAAREVAAPHFCCSACELAYGIIHGAGLGAYYERRDRIGVASSATRATGKSYAEYDDAAFLSRYVTESGADRRLELFLEGIHCTACVWLVERLPRLLPGVRSASLELGRSALEVVFDEARVAPSAIARALDTLGYAPHPSAATQRAGERRAERALWVRLGVAGALAGNVMLMALALYSGAAEDAPYATLFRWGSLLLTLPSVFFCGSVFLRGGWAALRTRVPHMDLPISIGILAGFAQSAYNTLFGRGEVYFDSLAVLIFLLLVGRWLQQRHHQRAQGALDLIAALSPVTARLVDGEAVRDVPASAVREGDLVEVPFDERLPVDGIVVAGRSSIDAAWLTGESLPEDVKPGDRVYAGTLNREKTLVVRVESPASGTRLARLLESVEKAQTRRAPIVRLADRVAGVFVLVVLALAAVTFGVWSFIDGARALDHAVALLVVTCPCALGMATPLAVSAALKRAARTGIFFKGGEFLEALARPGTIAFDKTGTLTEGRLALASYEGDSSVKPLVSAAESRSGHPVGRALVAAFGASQSLSVESVAEEPGLGLAARVDGHEVRIGTSEHVGGKEASSSFPWREARARAAELGRPAVAIAVDGEVRAVAAFSDPLREDTRASLDALRRAGYSVAVLSGDQPRVVATIAERLGPVLEARGGMLPEQKQAWIEQARERGPVVMVGDGVNDAAALAAADVAIAVHGGAEASLGASDVFTTAPGVGKVLEAVLGARRTLAVIRRGIAFSLAYNVAGVVLCMGGWISPLVAALLMPLSSLTVVTQALRARTFDAPRRTA